MLLVQTLRDLMRRLEIPESTLKQVSSWFGERMAAMKLSWESPDRHFHRMEALDHESHIWRGAVAGIAGGLVGRHAVWRRIMVWCR